MRIYTADDLQYKINSANEWTVVCRQSSSKQPEIIIPESIANRKITKIEHCAFKNDMFLEVLKIPRTIEKIGHESFLNCNRLKTLIINPAGKMLNIRQKAFQDCKYLKEICLLRPTSIDEFAFAGCSSLKMVEGQIDRLSMGSFEDCKKLQKITFFNSVVIETDALYNCSSLREIVFYDNPVLTDEFVEQTLSKVTIRCKKDSWLTSLAYDGFCVELI